MLGALRRRARGVGQRKRGRQHQAPLSVKGEEEEGEEEGEVDFGKDRGSAAASSLERAVRVGCALHPALEKMMHWRSYNF